jgi:hypothetical protein
MTMTAASLSSRGLDHVVHAVRDLDAAGALYSRLGFTVGARNRHPWGTHNRIVQLPGFFIELLTMAEPGKLGTDVLSELFGAFQRDFLRRHEGLSMLILESKDAAGDARVFAQAGISASPSVRFEREGRRPDGAAAEVAFSLAFAREAQTSDAGFATCQQHHPENFWNADYQRHANRVSRVAGAVLVAENPSDHHIFLSAFVGERELISNSAGVAVDTPRGEIQIMDPAAFRSHFRTEPPAAGSGLRIAALRLVSADLSAVAAALTAVGLSAEPFRDRLVVPPQAAMGATLVFEAA